MPTSSLPHCRAIAATLAVALSLTVPVTAVARAQAIASPTLGWSGWARCVIDVQGQSYSHRETHTWTMGGPPSMQGAFATYPGTWSVVGGGSLQFTQGTQTLAAQWATNAAPVSAPLAVFRRASDGALLVQSRHTLLRAPNAVQGYQQQTLDGKPQKPATIGLEAFEWTFPAIVATPSRTVAGVVQPGTATGAATQPVTGKVGPMQPAGVRGTAACTWQFGQASAAPAPAPPVEARAVPIPP